MDKRKVIAAYRRGDLTLRECAQVLGVDPRHAKGLLIEPFRYVEHVPGQQVSHVSLGQRNQAARPIV